MTIRHFTPEELANRRAQFPGHWFVEVVGKGFVVLLRIPATKENENRVLNGSPGLTPDMLDGKSVKTTPDAEAACA